MGDPGVAKSQLLRFIASISPRGIYTSGKGARRRCLRCAHTAFFSCCCFSLHSYKCVTLVPERNQRCGSYCCSHEGQVNSGANHFFASATTASVLLSTSSIDMRIHALFRCAGAGAGRGGSRPGRPRHMLHRRVRQDGGGRSHGALYSPLMDVPWCLCVILLQFCLENPAVWCDVTRHRRPSTR